MPRSYLIYQLTPPELPVAICYSAKEVAEFLGVNLNSAYRYLDGTRHRSDYGIFVDEYDPETLDSVHPLPDGAPRSPYLTTYHKSPIPAKGEVS